MPWSDTVIYEAHLRGLTSCCDDIPPHERGTFAALADPTIIDHLRRLGVTAVELLPIHAFVQDRFLVEKGSPTTGATTRSASSPSSPRYLSEGSSHEMRVAVRRLHAAGIEVILDVVYNHTAEGSELGPTLSFRGSRQRQLLRLVPDNPRHCINDTGTGNTLNLSHPRVLQMVMDSLRYWVTIFHVDGFRFDLGVTLGREPTASTPAPVSSMRSGRTRSLSRVKLISEPGTSALAGTSSGTIRRLCRVERPVSRRHPPLLARRCRAARRIRGAPRGLERHFRPSRAAVLGLRSTMRASHDGFTLPMS